MWHYKKPKNPELFDIASAYSRSGRIVILRYDREYEDYTVTVGKKMVFAHKDQHTAYRRYTYERGR